MTARALKAPLETGHKWRLRLTATAAAVALGVGIFMIQRIPAATTLHSGEDELAATSTQTMALYNLRAAPVMQYDGALDTGLRVSVSTGRLSIPTRNNLFRLGIQLPNVRGGHLQWQGRPPAGGRISIKIGNQRQSPDAGIMLQATGSGHVAELSVRAVQTVLTAEIDVASPGGQIAAAPELKFGDATVSDPALAFSPIQIEIPPGETMNLTFDSEHALADSSFRLGELIETGGSATALSIGRAEIGRLSGTASWPRLRSVIQGVCSARTGKLLFIHLYPHAGECGLAEDRKDDNLFATDITIEPRKVGLALEGSGFVVNDGHARPAALWSTLMANPLIAALIAALVYAIGRPLWRLWTGRDM